MDNIRRKKKRLGDILLAEGLLSQEQLEVALGLQREKRQRLGEILVDEGLVVEGQIADALHKQLNLEVISLTGMIIPEDITKLANEQILKKYKVMPFAFKDNSPNVLRVAMADPMDILAIDDLSIITNMQIEPVICTPVEIAAMIDKHYGNKGAMAVAEQYSRERKSQVQQEEINLAEKENISNSPIVLLVKTIIEQAVRQRASDIHIEPLEKSVRVRYRVDGNLNEVMIYDVELLSAIVARIKIIGGMDISEKRKPQDGRTTIIVDRQEFDIRVSILPTVFGEKIVMRLTSKKGLTKSKRELGLSKEDFDKFDKILSNPNGIILVTGPTGSGKSTTLYTALNELNTNDVNIITVEDPVEANIDGVNQVQVNPKAELTFASALRSILRQDPDIIMIGEIRDAETAEIAVKASITGHLVVSTLHTNSASSTITRLADMGIEPYLIADATVGVIAQRLVKRLCEHCKKPRKVNELERQLLECDEDTVIYHAKGCSQCNDTGYWGRMGVYEIMPITQKLKEIISKKGTSEDIKQVALTEGMRTLRMAAAQAVLDGITTVGELEKVSFEI